VVEGYMDVIALAQAGFADTVAPLGTALTEQQLTMLWRMTEKPLLCFDGDNAGQKAAMRAAMRALPMLKPAHSLQFVTLPEGQDPDDLVKASGANALTALLETAEPLVERLWNTEKAAGPLDTPEDRAALKSRLGVHMANMADGEIRRHYADAFRERFDNLFAQRPRAPFVPSGKGGKWQKPVNVPTSQQAKSIGRQGSDMLLQGVLTSLLLNPALIEGQREALGTFIPRDPNHAALLNALLDVTFPKETLETQGLLTILEAKLYNVAMMLLSGDGRAFAFNRIIAPHNADDLSRISKELGEAIKLMKQRPALESALEQATMRASTELTEENYAEQQRLRSEKEAFDYRISALLQRDSDF
jgi:DNA primase